MDDVPLPSGETLPTRAVCRVLSDQSALVVCVFARPETFAPCRLRQWSALGAMPRAVG
jgi:hypothetical protein